MTVPINGDKTTLNRSLKDHEPLKDPEKRWLIEDFLVDYVHAINDFQLNLWPDFFAEDGVYQIVPRESYEVNLPLGMLYCEGKGMMADRILALESANIFEPHTYCHIISRPGLSLNEDGTVKSRSNFNVTRTMQDGRMEMFAVGKYVDKIVFVNGSPLFKDRRVVLESRRVDILLVYPL